MNGVLPWLVLWACHDSTRVLCPTLSALVGQHKILISSPYTSSLHLSPSPSLLGSQSCQFACLLVCVTGIHPHTGARELSKDQLPKKEAQITSIWSLYVSAQTKKRERLRYLCNCELVPKLELPQFTMCTPHSNTESIFSSLCEFSLVRDQAFFYCLYMTKKLLDKNSIQTLQTRTPYKQNRIYFSTSHLLEERLQKYDFLLQLKLE